MASSRKFSGLLPGSGVASTSQCALHLPRRAANTFASRRSVSSSCLDRTRTSRATALSSAGNRCAAPRRQQLAAVWAPASQQVRHSHVGKQRIRIPPTASIDVLDFPPQPNPLKPLPQTLKGQGSILVKGPVGQILLPLLPKVYLFTRKQAQGSETAGSAAPKAPDAGGSPQEEDSHLLGPGQGIPALDVGGANQSATPSSDEASSRTLFVGVESKDTKEVRAAWGTTAAKLLNAIQGVTESHKFQLDLVGVGYRAALEEDPFPRLDDVELALQAIEEGSASKVKTHFTSSAQNQFYASHVQQWKEAQSTGTELDAHVKKDSDGKRARLRLHLRLGYSHPVLIPVPRGVTVAVPSPTVIKLWGADKEDLGLFAASIRMWRRPEPYKGKGIYVNGEKIQLRTAKKK